MVMGDLRVKTEVAVIGAGPGGYVAALRAADLGKEVVLVEMRERRGGVCLIEGCIPSKTLINAVELVEIAHAAKKMGIAFDGVKVDLAALREWKNSVVKGLTDGVDALLKRRGVEVVTGRAHFTGSKSLAIESNEDKASGVSGVDFEHCIIATGSRSATLPMLKDLPVWSSTEALEIPEVPQSLLVIGGGYIGLEMGLVYAGLGSRVTVVELLPSLLPGADPDLVLPLARNCQRRFEAIHLESKVTAVKRTSAGFAVTVEGKEGAKTLETARVLVAVGRKPNVEDIGLENTGVKLGPGGFIEVNPERRTTDPHIFAIGDVVPGPMLAHKASREGKVAAEVIAGHPSAFDNRAVPAVVFTDPEIAWTGYTEAEARERGMNVKVGKFPLTALGRAKTIGRTDGLVKIVTDADSGLIAGVGIAGPHASELIAEGTLAIEMGATVEDLLTTIHPHPTISEAMMEAAEMAADGSVHLMPQRAKGAAGKVPAGT